jgi:hypothetical protein
MKRMPPSPPDEILAQAGKKPKLGRPANGVAHRQMGWWDP